MNPERGTESTSEKAVRGFLIGSLGATLVKVSMLISNLIILRALSVHEYGLWVLATALVGLFYTFAFDGFDRVVQADLARLRGRGEGWGCFSLFRQYAVAMTGIALVLVMIFVSYVVLVGRYPPTLFVPLMALAPTLVSETAKRVIRTFFSSELDFARAAMVDTVGRLMYAGLVIVLVGLAPLGLLGVVTAYALSSVLGAVAFLPSFLRRIHKARWSERANDVIASLGDSLRAHGKWAILSEIVEDLTRNAIPWIVGGVVGVQAAGLFGFARNTLSQLVSMFPISNILNSVLPHEYEEPERFEGVARRALKYSFWLAVPAMGFVPLIWAIVHLLLPNYRAALPYLYTLLPSVVLSNGAAVLLFMFYSAQRQQSLFIGNLVKPVYVFTVLLVLTWQFGLWGAVTGYVILTGLLFWTRYLLAQRTLGFSMSWHEILEVDEADRRQFRRFWGSVRSLSLVRPRAPGV